MYSGVPPSNDSRVLLKLGFRFEDTNKTLSPAECAELEGRTLESILWELRDEGGSMPPWSAYHGVTYNPSRPSPWIAQLGDRVSRHKTELEAARAYDLYAAAADK